MFCLPAQEQKAYQFTYDKTSFRKDEEAKKQFISLRPFLVYTVNGQRNTMILPTVIYSPAIKKDQEIIDLIKQNK